MPVVLIDANIEGHGLHIWKRIQASTWWTLANDLEVTFKTFHDIDLDRASPDDVVWRLCQADGYYLLTSNRNEDSADSLEATIRKEGTPVSLPVFTLPLPDRVYHSPVFLERVIDKLLDYLMYAENYAGTGRLYLP